MKAWNGEYEMFINEIEKSKWSYDNRESRRNQLKPAAMKKSKKIKPLPRPLYKPGSPVINQKKSKKTATTRRRKPPYLSAGEEKKKRRKKENVKKISKSMKKISAADYRRNEETTKMKSERKIIIGEIMAVNSEIKCNHSIRKMIAEKRKIIEGGVKANLYNQKSEEKWKKMKHEEKMKKGDNASETPIVKKVISKKSGILANIK